MIWRMPVFLMILLYRERLATTCVEQPIHRLTWAISAALNLCCKGYDVGNAFAEAPAPVDPFFMYPDAQYREWWEGLGNDPIPDGMLFQSKRHYRDTQNHLDCGTNTFRRCLLMNLVSMR